MLTDHSTVLTQQIAYSLITSLVEGMIYLHDTHINYHGNLKSSTCLVSSSWSIKITGFGIQSVRRRSYTQRGKSFFNLRLTLKLNVFIMVDLLWVAPEILRNPQSLGTREGDVYSFAIIMHEIAYRLGPFAINIAHKSSAGILLIRASSMYNYFVFL